LFSPGSPVSSTYKTYHHDIAEILLKVALNTITLAPYPLINKSNGLAKIKYLEYVNFITQRDGNSVI
jgi:hypothetical protein